MVQAYQLLIIWKGLAFITRAKVHIEELWYLGFDVFPSRVVIERLLYGIEYSSRTWIIPDSGYILPVALIA
jgi:hypothetical protein